MSNWVKADVIYQKEEKGGEEKGGRREPRNVWGTSLGGNLINPILNRWTLNCMGDTQVQMFKRKLGKWILHFGQRSELQTWILEAPHSGNLSGKKGKVGEDLYIFLLPKEIRRSTWKSPGALGIDHWPRLQRKLYEWMRKIPWNHKKQPWFAQEAASFSNRQTALSRYSCTKLSFPPARLASHSRTFQMSLNRGTEGFTSKVPWALLKSTTKSSFPRTISQGGDLTPDSILFKVIFWWEVDLAPSQEF